MKYGSWYHSVDKTNFTYSWPGLQISLIGLVRDYMMHSLCTDRGTVTSINKLTLSRHDLKTYAVLESTSAMHY